MNTNTYKAASCCQRERETGAGACPLSQPGANTPARLPTELLVDCVAVVMDNGVRRPHHTSTRAAVTSDLWTDWLARQSVSHETAGCDCDRRACCLAVSGGCHAHIIMPPSSLHKGRARSQPFHPTRCFFAPGTLDSTSRGCSAQLLWKMLATA